MRRICLFLLTLGLLTGLFPVFAQDATAEITPDVTPEVTPEMTIESTAEVTPEVTPEATIETTSEAESEATPEATEQPRGGNRAQFPGPGSYSVREDFGEALNAEQREFIIDIPTSYSEDGDPMPVVLVLHGAGGNGNGIRSISGFADLGQAEGFITVFPSGLNGAWNDGRPDPVLALVNDIAYIEHLIDLLTNSLNIDTTRIYAAGYSMGGMMSYRLGCNLPTRIAAVASVASTMPLYFRAECDAAPPVPVVIVQGTDDNVVPWMGIRNGYMTAEDSVDYWTAHNNCTATTELVVEPDTDPFDPTRVIREQYDECDAGVILYGVYGGGHTWPGGGMVAPIDIGVTSRDINASEKIWEFFQQYALPDAE